MTPDELVELERIKQLKYRYARCLDQKDWDGVEDCFTEDATASYGGTKPLEGREAILGFLRAGLESTSRITTHFVGQPEIELTGPGTAEGTWALHDQVIDTELGFNVRGASFYSDRYEKVRGVWLLAHTGYRRLYEELEKRSDDVRMTAHWWDTGGKSELIPD